MFRCVFFSPSWGDSLRQLLMPPNCSQVHGQEGENNYEKSDASKWDVISTKNKENKSEFVTP